MSYFVFRDARDASAAAFCRGKGFAAAGSVRSATLESLAKGVGALNMATLEQCTTGQCLVSGPGRGGDGFSSAAMSVVSQREPQACRQCCLFPAAANQALLPPEQAYIGIECVPAGRSACQLDARGNLGNNNVGANNWVSSM